MNQIKSNQVDLICFDLHYSQLPVCFPSFHESKLLTEAAKLQLKAAKTDILFKMLDSFNKNSIQVTTRWTLLDNMLGTLLFPSLNAERKPTSHTLPSLFTIIKKFPTVLFTLENNSDFEESSKTGKISTSFPPSLNTAITFMDTGAVKNTNALRTCIALMDNSFRRFADVQLSEKWTEPNTSYKDIGGTDP